MKKINMFFLVLSLNFGGTERHIYNLVSRLNRERFHIVICCLFELGSIGEAIRDNCKGIRIYHNLINNKLDVVGIWKLMNIIRKERIDILYTINSPLTQFWGALFSKLKRAACITRVATTNPTFHAYRRNFINRLMLPFVDIVIAQADSHKDYLVNSEGMKREKVTVIYNGVEIEKYQISTDNISLRNQTGVPEDGPIIGIVARLASEKGHEIFIKAARKIVDVFPKANFLIVGDGKERGRLENLSERYSIRSNVIFLGARKDIPQLLSFIDVAVLTSYPVVETFSNSILEYMAAGKPVVATDAGSTADMIEDGNTGFLVPVGDSDTMAKAIINILQNPDLGKQMGKSCRKRVQDKYSLSRMVDEYEKLFLDLVKS